MREYNRRNFKDGEALENIEQEITINVTAPIRLIAEILPTLKRQPQAVIVNVSSGLAFAPMADVPVYCATKAAIHSFTLSLRHQLKTTGAGSWGWFHRLPIPAWVAAP